MIRLIIRLFAAVLFKLPMFILSGIVSWYISKRLEEYEPLKKLRKEYEEHQEEEERSDNSYQIDEKT